MQHRHQPGDDGHVPVVPARVRHARPDGPVRDGVDFGNRQGVQFAAEQQRRAARPEVVNHSHALAPDLFEDSGRSVLIGEIDDAPGGLGFVAGEVRVGVQKTPKGG